MPVRPLGEPVILRPLSAKNMLPAKPVRKPDGCLLQGMGRPAFVPQPQFKIAVIGTCGDYNCRTKGKGEQFTLVVINFDSAACFGFQKHARAYIIPYPCF